MLIMLLLFPLIFLENSLVKSAGAFKFVDICFSQLLLLKFANLSFSYNEAFLTRQSK